MVSLLFNYEMICYYKCSFIDIYISMMTLYNWRNLRVYLLSAELQQTCCHERLLLVFLCILNLTCVVFSTFSVESTVMWVWPGLCAVCVGLKVLQLCSLAWWRLSSEMFPSLVSTSCSTARARPRCQKVSVHPGVIMYQPAACLYGKESHDWSAQKQLLLVLSRLILRLKLNRLLFLTSTWIKYLLSVFL